MKKVFFLLIVAFISVNAFSQLQLHVENGGSARTDNYPTLIGVNSARIFQFWSVLQGIGSYTGANFFSPGEDNWLVEHRYSSTSMTHQAWKQGTYQYVTLWAKAGSGSNKYAYISVTW